MTTGPTSAPSPAPESARNIDYDDAMAYLNECQKKKVKYLGVKEVYLNTGVTFDELNSFTHGVQREHAQVDKVYIQALERYIDDNMLDYPKTMDPSLAPEPPKPKESTPDIFTPPSAPSTPSSAYEQPNLTFDAVYRKLLKLNNNGIRTLTPEEAEGFAAVSEDEIKKLSGGKEENPDGSIKNVKTQAIIDYVKNQKDSYPRPNPACGKATVAMTVDPATLVPPADPGAATTILPIDVSTLTPPAATMAPAPPEAPKEAAMDAIWQPEEVKPDGPHDEHPFDVAFICKDKKFERFYVVKDHIIETIGKDYFTVFKTELDNNEITRKTRAASEFDGHICFPLHEETGVVNNLAYVSLEEAEKAAQRAGVSLESLQVFNIKRKDLNDGHPTQMDSVMLTKLAALMRNFEGQKVQYTRSKTRAVIFSVIASVLVSGAAAAAGVYAYMKGKKEGTATALNTGEDVREEGGVAIVDSRLQTQAEKYQGREQGVQPEIDETIYSQAPKANGPIYGPFQESFLDLTERRGAEKGNLLHMKVPFVTPQTALELELHDVIDGLNNNIKTLKSKNQDLITEIADLKTENEKSFDKEQAEAFILEAQEEEPDLKQYSNIAGIKATDKGEVQLTVFGGNVGDPIALSESNTLKSEIKKHLEKIRMWRDVFDVRSAMNVFLSVATHDEFLKALEQGPLKGWERNGNTFATPDSAELQDGGSVTIFPSLEVNVQTVNPLTGNMTEHADGQDMDAFKMLFGLPTLNLGANTRANQLSRENKRLQKLLDASGAEQLRHDATAALQNIKNLLNDAGLIDEKSGELDKKKLDELLKIKRTIDRIKALEKQLAQVRKEKNKEIREKTEEKAELEGKISEKDSEIVRLAKKLNDYLEENRKKQEILNKKIDELRKKLEAAGQLAHGNSVTEQPAPEALKVDSEVVVRPKKPLAEARKAPLTAPADPNAAENAEKAKKLQELVSKLVSLGIYDAVTGKIDEEKVKKSGELDEVMVAITAAGASYDVTTKKLTLPTAAATPGVVSSPASRPATLGGPEQSALLSLQSSLVSTYGTNALLKDFVEVLKGKDYSTLHETAATAAKEKLEKLHALLQALAANATALNDLGNEYDGGKNYAKLQAYEKALLAAFNGIKIKENLDAARKAFFAAKYRNTIKEPDYYQYTEFKEAYEAIVKGWLAELSRELKT